ncbi:MAG: hypothetical protein V3S89_00140 [Desulfobacterales bacterium]
MGNTTSRSKVDDADRIVLQRLAKRKAEIAADPTNLERKRLWYALDGGNAERPMVLAEILGVLNETLPDSVLECKDPGLRGLEYRLRMELYQFDILGDDHVIEPAIDMPWRAKIGDYGVSATMEFGDNDGRLGAHVWDHPIKDLDRDLEKLHFRTLEVDREGTAERKALWEDIFDGILPVRIRGSYWWSMGMTLTAIQLIGLENLMLYMYDNPEGLKRLMSFLRDDHLHLARRLEEEGLMTLNNENDYLGSGSIGYTHDLPRKQQDNGGARLKDLWVLLESQETVGVGPKQFEEFVFPYQASLAELFGKCYYGCCEPVNNRWHILKNMPGLSRVSVSPWADEEFMADTLGNDIVYSRKPNPTQISTGSFDEKAIRAGIARTLSIAKDCRVELIMKDVHTLNNQPERLARWVEIAREVIDEMYG